MMRKFLATLWILPLLLVVSMFVSACAGGGGSTAQQTAAAPPLELSIAEVDQYSKLGNKISDGQYVVVDLKLENKTNKNLTINSADFAIRNITTEQAEQYTQGPEAAMSPAFTKEFGPDDGTKLLETYPTISHPRIEMERFLIFMLPGKASLKKYELVYTPADKQYAQIVIPLVTELTRVNDNRTAY